MANILSNYKSDVLNHIDSMRRDDHNTTLSYHNPLRDNFCAFFKMTKNNAISKGLQRKGFLL